MGLPDFPSAPFELAGCPVTRVLYNSTDGIPCRLEDGGGTVGAGESAAGLRENPRQKSWEQGRLVGVRQAGPGAWDWRG
jgi:hypothetical protein